MRKKYIYLLVIFLTVSSCITFSRIANNDFVNIDDGKYITENDYVKAGFNKESIYYVSTAIVGGNWHPLALISHMVDWSLFGTNALGHHLVSLLLHICTVIILFFFLNKTTNNPLSAAFAAAFFALHPLRVESVAWAAERKDVLSMFFGMGTLYAYAFYAEKTNFSRYFVCLLLFIMALMSKPMMVTLPFLLLLLDYWPLKRLQRAFNGHRQRSKSIEVLIWEKVPFICLTMAATILAFWAQSRDEFVVSLDSLPFVTRIANVFVSYVAYLGKIFWPVNLALLYPYDYLPLWKILISGLILILITFVVLYHIEKFPFLFVGWFWYLGTLVPVIGLIQLSVQSIADRYTYLPFIGIAIMLGWGIPLLFSRKNISKKILWLFAIIVLVILSVLTWKQCGYWKNSITLFKHSILVTKDNYDLVK